jgi:hypothetical protein
VYGTVELVQKKKKKEKKEKKKGQVKRKKNREKCTFFMTSKGKKGQKARDG